MCRDEYRIRLLIFLRGDAAAILVHRLYRGGHLAALSLAAGFHQLVRDDVFRMFWRQSPSSSRSWDFASTGGRCYLYVPNLGID